MRTVSVQIGEVKSEAGEVLLETKAIGSCIAIAAYDSTKKIGALAHIMLPGRAPAKKKPEEKTKYAVDAINELVAQMTRLGSRLEDIKVVAVGGGNVLLRDDDVICEDNIKSVLKALEKKDLKVGARALGGTERRSICLDVENGIVTCAEGNGSDVQLWKA